MSAGAAIEARYRQRLATAVKIARWPAIGALVVGGGLLVARIVGPSVVEQLGARGGEGFARGVARAQDEIAAVKRQLSISGWGTYR